MSTMALDTSGRTRDDISDDAGETCADKSDSEHEEADDCKLHVFGVQR